jgi:hypothetical protein
MDSDPVLNGTEKTIYIPSEQWVCPDSPLEGPPIEKMLNTKNRGDSPANLLEFALDYALALEIVRAEKDRFR